MVSVLVDLLRMVLSTVFDIYIGIVWLRFVLQWVRADFYNPFSQFVVRATAPLLHPMRRIIPGFKGLDMAALVLILLLKLFELTLYSLIVTQAPMPVQQLLFYTVVELLSLLLSFYFGAIMLMVIMSWVVSAGGHHPLFALLMDITEPVCAPARRLIPPMGGLDLSPLLVIFILNLLMRLLGLVAESMSHSLGMMF